MKIAMLQTPMFPLNLTHCAGVERVELSELEGLNKLGYKVKLFVPKLIGDDPNIIEIKDIGWQSRIFKFYYYFSFWFKARGADLFHGHYAPILALLFPKKSVIHFHGDSVFMLPLYRYLKSRYHQAHYIFLSRYFYNKFHDKYPEIPEEQLHVLYNAINEEVFVPKEKKAVVGKAKICFCGRWNEEKGIFVLLEAIKILEKSRHDFRLYLVGSPHIPVRDRKTETLESEINEKVRGLSSVEIVGPVEYHKLPELYGQMDIGVVPSVWAEPFGLVAIEMMACGIPVIASRVGGLPEIIDDNINGVLVEPNNPLALVLEIGRLLDDANQRQKLGLVARRQVETKFAWKRHLEGLLDIYRQVSAKKDHEN